MVEIVIILIIGSFIVMCLDREKKDVIINKEDDIEKMPRLDKKDIEFADALKKNIHDEKLELFLRHNKEIELENYYKQKIMDRKKNHQMMAVIVPLLVCALFGLLLREFLIDFGYHDGLYYVSYFGTSKFISEKYCEICELYTYLSNALIVVSSIGLVLYSIIQASNEDMIKLPETKMFYFCISIMIMSFAGEILLLRYIIWPNSCFLIINSYFGLCNIWHALFVLAQVTMVILFHRKVDKFHRIKIFEDKVYEYYDNRRKTRID